MGFIHSIIVLFFIILLFKCLLKLVDVIWKSWILSKIPGPKRNWILGNLPNLFSAREDEYNTLMNWGNKHWPIFSLVMPFVNIVFISSPEDIKILLSGKKHLEKGQLYDFLKKWLRDNLITISGFRYQETRRLIAPAFNKSQNFPAFLNIFQHEAENVIKQLKMLDENSDIIPIFTEFMFKTMAESTFGVKMNLENDEHKRYYNNVKDLFKITMDRFRSPWLYSDLLFYKFTSTGRKAARYIKEIHDFSEKVFSEKIEQDDFNIKDPNYNYLLINILLNAHQENLIKFDEISQHFDGVLLASMDLVSATIAYLLLELSANQKYQNLILEEIHQFLQDKKECTVEELNKLIFLDMCVKETIRKYPPLSLIARRTGEEMITSQGYRIPKDVDVIVSILNLHRNPEIYSEPDKFDPYRFLPENIKTRHQFAYLPFSAGIRSCIGSRFSLLQIKLLAVKILENFVVLPIDTPDTIKFMLDITLQPKNGIKLKFIKRYHGLNN